MARSDRKTARKQPSPDRPRLFRTQNDLSAAARSEVCGLLN